jgi:purine-nucleoside/S-methyl-5'-thioadenosine phosphorylase / adenosine deaminase
MERRDLGNGAYSMVSSTLETRGFLAAFTERTGGVSPAPYDSLNLGLRTNDAPGRVIENRRRMIEALDVPRFATGEQPHGAKLVRVGGIRAGAGFDDRGSAIKGADALTVSQRNLPVGVLSADCVLVALASPEEQLLVVAHAGWRGMAAGVLGRAIAEFDRPSGVLGVIGPAIGPCHYEVGEDVALAVASGSGAGAVSDRKDGRRYLDLPRTAAKVFRAAGVRRIEVSDLCTACLPDRFFSHRRDGLTGRQALVSMVL